MRTIAIDIDKTRSAGSPGAASVEIIAGDLNLPPYDEAVVGEHGLFANRDLSFVRGSRGTIRRALFNTAWAALGGNAGALGTYYHNSLPHGPWHVPDQVLVDPALMTRRNLRVRIITRVSGRDLATSSGRPTRTNGSDHFPVLVELIPHTADADIDPGAAQKPTSEENHAGEVTGAWQFRREQANLRDGKQ